VDFLSTITYKSMIGKYVILAWLCLIHGSIYLCFGLLENQFISNSNARFIGRTKWDLSPN